MDFRHRIARFFFSRFAGFGVSGPARRFAVALLATAVVAPSEDLAVGEREAVVVPVRQLFGLQPFGAEALEGRQRRGPLQTELEVRRLANLCTSALAIFASSFVARSFSPASSAAFSSAFSFSIFCNSDFCFLSSCVFVSGVLQSSCA